MRRQTHRAYTDLPKSTQPAREGTGIKPRSPGPPPTMPFCPHPSFWRNSLKQLRQQEGPSSVALRPGQWQCLCISTLLSHLSSINWERLFKKCYLFLYLFLAALGLCGCTWAFSSGGRQGLLSNCGARASHCGGFSCCWAQVLEQSLSSWGTRA